MPSERWLSRKACSQVKQLVILISIMSTCQKYTTVCEFIYSVHGSHILCEAEAMFVIVAVALSQVIGSY